MTTFIALAIAMVSIALCWVLPSLLQRGGTASGTDAADANLAVLRSQLADLDADEHLGISSVQQLAQRRIDIERRTLAETPLSGSRSRAEPTMQRARVCAACVAIAIPGLAALLYSRLGDPHAAELTELMRGQISQQNSAPDLARYTTLLSRRLDREPDNVGAWVTLARAHAGQRRWADALPAYRHAVELLPGDADLKVEYAQALATRGGVASAADSTALLEQALALAPYHRKALTMAGAQAFDRKDYAAAIGFWERLRPQLPAAEAALSQQLAGAVQMARSRASSAIDSAPGTAVVSTTGVTDASLRAAAARESTASADSPPKRN